MHIPHLHPWTTDPDEAIRIQETLRESGVGMGWSLVHTICGIDASYTASSIWAAIAIFHYPDLTSIGVVTAQAPLVFPYQPGLLAFRVVPAILAAWEKMTQKPDLLLVHGHGVAHPRGMGLASHLGLWLDIPSIGVAKSRLYGCQAEVGLQGRLEWTFG